MSKNLLLASTSTVYGSDYLAYLSEDVERFFSGSGSIVFIPYARPSGISHEDYTRKAAEAFAKAGLKLKGIHEWDDPGEALAEAGGVFTGGGNTFVLLKTLQENGLMELLKKKVENGLPYMGTSAGSNIAGQSIATTNDMPIVYPHSFDALGLVPFNLNPHYIDPDPGSRHMGETRETRIGEFHEYNDIPVVGLREGSTLEIHDGVVRILGSHTVRVFRHAHAPTEISKGEELSRLFFEKPA